MCRRGIASKYPNPLSDGYSQCHSEELTQPCCEMVISKSLWLDVNVS